MLPLMHLQQVIAELWPEAGRLSALALLQVPVDALRVERGVHCGEVPVCASRCLCSVVCFHRRALLLHDTVSCPLMPYSCRRFQSPEINCSQTCCLARFYPNLSLPV